MPGPSSENRIRRPWRPHHRENPALAADTVSIATIELVDNAIVLAVPNAMAAGLLDSLFWWSLALGLAIAFAAAFPVNRALIARGRGHALVHHLHVRH